MAAAAGPADFMLLESESDVSDSIVPSPGTQPRHAVASPSQQAFHPAVGRQDRSRRLGGCAPEIGRGGREVAAVRSQPRLGRRALAATARRDALARLTAAKQAKQWGRPGALSHSDADSEGGSSVGAARGGAAASRRRAAMAAVVLSSDKELGQEAGPIVSGSQHESDGGTAPAGPSAAKAAVTAAAAAPSPPATSGQDGPEAAWDMRGRRVRQRGASGGRRRRIGRFVTGGRDYAVSESDTDLDGFVVASSGAEEEEKSSSSSSSDEGDGDTTGQRLASTPAGQQPTGRKKRNISGILEDSSESEESLTSGLRQRAGRRPPPPQQRQQQRRQQGRKRQLRGRRALVVETSSEEDELPLAEGAVSGAAVGVGSGPGEQQPARKRLRKGAGGAQAHAAALPAVGGTAEKVVGEAEAGTASAEPSAAVAAAAMAAATAAGVRPRRAQARAAQREQPTAAQRIRRAQQRWQRQGTGAGGRGSGGSSSEEDEAGGEPEGEGSELQQHKQLELREPSAAAPSPTGPGGSGAGQLPPAKRPRRQTRQDWQQAASTLGVLGGYSEQELFSIYVELLLMCLVDEGYAEVVEQSPSHRAYYQRAVAKVEQQLELKRSAVASNAWKSSACGLLAALESLPGISTSWGGQGAGEDESGQLLDGACAACNRRRSHATRLLVLKGRPYASASGAPAGTSSPQTAAVSAAAAAAAATGAEAAGDEAEEGSMAVPGEEEGREGQQGGGSSSSRQRGRQERQRVEFAVGRYCCGRLAAYHALFHYRHRLQARLKRELKSELRTRKRLGQSLDRGAVADAVLRKDSLLTGLYRNYRSLLELAERYQLAGGEDSSRAAWQTEFEGMHAEVSAAVLDLHSDSEGEERSVAWPDEQGSDSESDAQQESGEERGGSHDSDASPGGQGGSGGSRLRQREGAGCGSGGTTGDAAADRLLCMLRAKAQAQAQLSARLSPGPEGGTSQPVLPGEVRSPNAPRGNATAAAAAAGVAGLHSGGQGSARGTLASPSAVAARGGLSPAAVAARGALSPAARSAAVKSERRWLSGDALIVRNPPGLRMPAGTAAGGAGAALSPLPNQQVRQQQQQHGQLAAPAHQSSSPGVMHHSGSQPAVVHPTRLPLQAQHNSEQQQQQQAAAGTPRTAGASPAGAQRGASTPGSSGPSSRGSGLRQVGISSFFGPSPQSSRGKAALGASPGAGKPGGSGLGQAAGPNGRAGWKPRGLGEAMEGAAAASQQ